MNLPHRLLVWTIDFASLDVFLGWNDTQSFFCIVKHRILVWPDVWMMEIQESFQEIHETESELCGTCYRAFHM
jgi:hypothetical protein